MTGEAEQQRKRQRTEATPVAESDAGAAGAENAWSEAARAKPGGEEGEGQTHGAEGMNGMGGSHGTEDGSAPRTPVTPEAVPEYRDDQLLRDVASTGKVTLEWSRLLGALEGKLAQVLCFYAEKFGELEDLDGVGHQERCRLLQEELTAFDGPPFTIQRLAEVLLAPHPQYTATHKLVNGLEKLLSVSSTLESFEEDCTESL